MLYTTPRTSNIKTLGKDSAGFRPSKWVSAYLCWVSLHYSPRQRVRNDPECFFPNRRTESLRYYLSHYTAVSSTNQEHTEPSANEYLSLQDLKPLSARFIWRRLFSLSVNTCVRLRIMRCLLNAVCKCCLFISAHPNQRAENTKQRYKPPLIVPPRFLGVFLLLLSAYCGDVAVRNGNLIKCFEICRLWSFSRTKTGPGRTRASSVHRDKLIYKLLSTITFYEN